jgi:hypothetical protein
VSVFGQRIVGRVGDTRERVRPAARVPWAGAPG